VNQPWLTSSYAGSTRRRSDVCLPVVGGNQMQNKTIDVLYSSQSINQAINQSHIMTYWHPSSTNDIPTSSQNFCFVINVVLRIQNITQGTGSYKIPKWRQLILPRHGTSSSGVIFLTGNKFLHRISAYI
jgi:hypothetical protein